MRYQPSAQGDWGSMRTTDTIKIGTEHITTPDGCKIFLRSWQTDSKDILLLMHGLGGHSGWYIDLGNELSSKNINVYAMDHRGFGRSEGLAAHIDRYQTFIDDIASVVTVLHKRHKDANVYILGHSMGGIFATYFSATYGNMLSGAIFLNPWIQDSAKIPLGTTLSIFGNGLLKSKRPWQVGGGHEAMTSNIEARQLLDEDPLWRRARTASFLVQIFFMRLGVLKLAKRVTIPTLVLQAELDQAIRPTATRKFYQTLASSDKTWISYPDYYHDSQFEDERTQMDDDIVNWLHKHSQ